MWPRLRRHGFGATRRYRSGRRALGHDEPLPGPLEDVILHPGEWEVLRREALHLRLSRNHLLDHVAELRLKNGHAVGGDRKPLRTNTLAEHLQERVHTLRLEAEVPRQELEAE